MNNFKKLAICLLPMAAFVLSAAAQDVISTVVGGGPNNLPGTTANLNAPYTEAVDAAGNIYVAASAAAPHLQDQHQRSRYRGRGHRRCRL